MKTKFFRTLSLSLLLLTALAALDCGSKTSQGLTVTANPKTPIVIDQGNSITLANGDTVTPPYFSINNIKVTWTSTTADAQVLALKFVSTGTTATSSAGSCVISGNDLTTLFSSVTYYDANGTLKVADLVDANQNITIPKAVVGAFVPTYITSVKIYCSGLTVTPVSGKSIFTNYNVPMDVILYGQTVDATGNSTGRVTGFSNITLQ